MPKKQPPIHHPDDPQCRELFARMSEYLDKELDETGMLAFEAHLRHCPPCRSCLATLERTIDLCHALPTPVTDEDFSRRLRERLARFIARSDFCD